MVLFSVAGLSAALARHGFMASGWHSIGKTAPLSTLVVDMSAAAPGVGQRVHDAIVDRPIGQKVIELDPRTKFVLYARRAPGASRAPHRQPARVARQPERMAEVETAILEELETLAGARRLCSWMTDSYRAFVPGARVLEVGAGIGTFSQGMLDAGAASMLLIEPEPQCHAELVRRLGDDPRVTTSTDFLPGAPSLASPGADGSFDLVVCQNVLEHIADDEGALAEMARVLRPGGHLALLVPSGPKLFGSLDDAYGHWRRYSSGDLSAIVGATGLVIESLRPMNTLGIAGWWAKKHRPGARVGSTSLSAYEALVSMWRPLEERLRPNVGLSLVCIARKP
jgi:2-polyprenyl-3-methyl-5-hydroxy-6-metoxy-1,4-benzoquinol methylase